MGWEGVQATRNKVELNVFPLSEAGVPYGYTPVLLAHPKYCKAGSEEAELLRRFLEVSARGHQYAAAHPTETADALISEANHASLTELGRDFVVESQRLLSEGDHYLNESKQWGHMEPARWEQFVDWLFANNCITARDGSVLPR
jgi:NitT/TauT family transport system substrate-binding protein